jgi:hypothetical protein
MMPPALNDRQSYITLTLADGRVIDVFPLTFGRARIGISQDATVQAFDDLW